MESNLWSSPKIRVDGGPLEHPANALERPIEYRPVPPSMWDSVLWAALYGGGGVTLIGFGLFIGWKSLLSMVLMVLGAFALWMTEFFVSQSIREWREERRALHILYRLTDAVVVEHGSARTVSLAEAIEVAPGAPAQVQRMARVRQALLHEPPGSNTRRAMEWAAWIHWITSHKELAISTSSSRMRVALGR